MSIQWFPGHMHKARKQVEEILPQIHLVIEVLDARIPYSSANPMIAELRGSKPCIKVMTKSDLADPAITTIWQQHYEQQERVKTLALSLEQSDKTRLLTELCRKLLPQRDSGHGDIHAMILGIPNVGKSTLINTLAGKSVAKTGNEPAITKGQQRINLRNGIMLFDTPGMLWPKVENEASGYRLATTGAIKDTAISHTDVAFFAADYLLKHYPERLQQRYALATTPDTELALLEELGRARGCLKAGGRVDLEKASTLLLNELRAGTLGQLSFETPEMIEQELKLVEQQRAEKAAKKQARLEQRQKKRRKK